ncbi:MAG TPA: amidase family protein [Vineibacter sp.]|nr:amidase family protein [Vineibacter sp.]
MSDLTFAELRSLDTTAMLAAYRAGTLSPVDVTDAALAAVETINPKINAIFHVDRDGALTQARASEARWRLQAPRGRLDGVPTVIKDGLQWRGVPGYRGSMALKGHARAPDTDSPCVARLRENGAVLLGKTIMCDFGMLSSGYSSMFGPVRNPWDLSRTSGGSSAGTGAALAAGIVPIAPGTDILGSVRVPASFCGLTGLKPSFGRVPHFPQTSPAAVSGPMARNVTDMARLMSVMAAPDDRDFSALAHQPIDYEQALERSFKGSRVGFLSTMGFGTTPDRETLDVFKRVLPILSAIGCEIEEIPSPFKPGDERVAEDFYRLRPLNELESLPPESRDAVDIINRWADPARRYTALDHFRHYLGTLQLRARALAMMGTFDFLVLPTTPLPAFAAELPAPDPHALFAPFCNTFLFNLTEQPALSLPCGHTAGGLPVGLQLVGRRFDDVGVIQLAYAIERAQDRRVSWPALA